MSDILDKIDAIKDLSFPEERRALREAAGLSQDDIAREIGTTRAAVSRWESGDRFPRGAHLFAYAEILRALRKELAR